MKRILFVAAFFVAVSCGAGSKDAPDPDKPAIPEEVGTPTFAKGADIGWASEMEAEGRKFRHVVVGLFPDIARKRLDFREVLCLVVCGDFHLDQKDV